MNKLSKLLKEKGSILYPILGGIALFYGTGTNLLNTLLCIAGVLLITMED